VKIDADENLLLVRGAVPGPTGSYIVIKKALKTQKTQNVQKEQKAQKAK
jgi:ribosomal protein L3